MSRHNKTACWINADTEGADQSALAYWSPPLLHGRIQRGGVQRVRTPTPENRKNKGYLSHTAPDNPEISHSYQASIQLGHHGPASETPFKWRFIGGPMMAHFSDIWTSTKKIIKKIKKKVTKYGPPPTKLSGSAHALSGKLVAKHINLRLCLRKIRRCPEC